VHFPTISSFFFSQSYWWMQYNGHYCHDTVACLPVPLCLSVMRCIVAKRYILQQQCLNRWIGSAPRNMILQLPTPTPIPCPQTQNYWTTIIISAVLLWCEGRCRSATSVVGQWALMWRRAASANRCSCAAKPANSSINPTATSSSPVSAAIAMYINVHT